MLSVSPAYEAAIKSATRDMTYRVTLDGSVVLGKDVVTNMTLSESVGDSNGLAVGSSNAAELTLTLRNPDVLEYKGMKVEPESGIVLPDGSIEWVPLGKFWVTNVSTANDYKTVKLTCADGMYLLSNIYVSDLMYPASIKAVVREIVAQAGVDFVEPDVWPDVVVRVKPENLTLRNAIGCAAGCCGRNARFNRQGKLEFTWYQDTGVTIERDTQYLDGMVKLHDKPLQVSFNVTGAKEKYECNVVCGDNGMVTATPAKNIFEGDVVSISVRPDNQYKMAYISAADARGNAVALTEDSKGVGYTFIQPDSNVTVTASFKPYGDGPFKLKVRSEGNGSISYAVSDIGHEEGYEYFDAGEEVVLFVAPNDGFSVSEFYIIPGGVDINRVGTSGDGEDVYSFIMPDGDVDITVRFRDEGTNSISWNLVHDCPYEPAILTITNDTAGGKIYRTGDVISVNLAVITGYEVDRIDCNVDFTPIDNNNFRFVMPDNDVSITVYLKQVTDDSNAGSCSFLQPVSFAAPPTAKPYWAVLYVYDESGYGKHSKQGVNGKYYLVYFDSWSASGTTRLDGKDAYVVTTKGYYYCGSESDANGQHRWDTSSWYGNGSASSSKTWEMPIVRWDKGYCLVATNANLYLNSNVVFQRNDTAIGVHQTNWLVDGVDVRESGALSRYPCPDTYSTPPPGMYWIVVDNGYVYKANDDELYGFERIIGDYRDTILYFDSVTVENVGKHWSNEDNDVFKMSFPNATVIKMAYEGDLDSATVINEPCYIMIEDPSLLMRGKNAAQGRSENTCGLLASNVTISCDGMIFHDNAPILCDCAPAARMFSMRSANADTVALTYTNPMIYEKAASAVQNAMQSVTYTPAKVKHRGNPAFQAGDVVTVPDGKGAYHTVLIVQQTMNFGGGMNSEIVGNGKTEESASYESNGPISSMIKDEVNNSYSELEHEVSTNNAIAFSALNKSVAAVNKTVNEFGAEIESLAKWQSETNKSVSDITQNVSKHQASIDMLTEWQGEAAESITRVEQRVSENDAAIELLSKFDGDVAESLAKISANVNEHEASILSITEWQGEASTSIASIQQEVSQNKSSIGLLVDNGTVKGEVLIEAINDESFAKIRADRLDIEGKTLNIKVDATNIEGTLTAEKIDVEGVIIAGGAYIEDIVANEISATKFTADLGRVTGTLSASNIDCYGVFTAAKADITELVVDKVDANYIEGFDLNFTHGKIGGWDITEDGISKGGVSLFSKDILVEGSVVTGLPYSVRFAAGKTSSTHTHKGLQWNNPPQIHDDYVILHYDYQVSLDVPDIKEFIASVSFPNSGFASESEVERIDYDYDEHWIDIYVRTTSAVWDIQSVCAIDVTFEYGVDFNTKILDDGSIYARAVQIEPDIEHGGFDTTVMNFNLLYFEFFGQRYALKVMATLPDDESGDTTFSNLRIEKLK